MSINISVLAAFFCFLLLSRHIPLFNTTERRLLKDKMRECKYIDGALERKFKPPIFSWATFVRITHCNQYPEMLFFCWVISVVYMGHHLTYGYWSSIAAASILGLIIGNALMIRGLKDSANIDYWISRD